MKKYLLYINCFLVSMFISTITIAQPPADPCVDPLLDCPIDDGVIVLIAFAVLIAIKKVYDYKKSIRIV